MAEETTSTGRSLGHLGIPDTNSQDPNTLRGAVLGFPTAGTSDSGGETGFFTRSLTRSLTRDLTHTLTTR